MLLRRTKKTVLNGRPLLDLPERNVELVRLTFTPNERVFYDTLEGKSREDIKA